jgi:hypothetical protein
MKDYLRKPVKAVLMKEFDVDPAGSFHDREMAALIADIEFLCDKTTDFPETLHKIRQVLERKPVQYVVFKAMLKTYKL